MNVSRLETLAHLFRRLTRFVAQAALIPRIQHMAGLTSFLARKLTCRRDRCHPCQWQRSITVADSAQVWLLEDSRPREAQWRSHDKL